MAVDGKVLIGGDDAWICWLVTDLVVGHSWVMSVRHKEDSWLARWKKKEDEESKWFY